MYMRNIIIFLQCNSAKISSQEKQIKRNNSLASVQSVRACLKRFKHTHYVIPTEDR